MRFVLKVERHPTFYISASIKKDPHVYFYISARILPIALSGH